MISPCVFRQRDSKRNLAFIEITNNCNMRCRHCMNWSTKDSTKGFSKEDDICSGNNSIIIKESRCIS